MVVSGLRKIRKKNPMQNIVIQSLPDLSGGINCFGRIGSGKSVFMLTIAQQYHDHPFRKYKIFDLWGGDRNEHLYWTLPSNKIEYWKSVCRIFKLDKSGPKQYQVKLLYPMWSKLPKKLPHNPPFVKSQIFTIPFSDLKIEDIALISGPLSSRDESVWNDSIYGLTKKANASELLQKMRDAKAETYTIFRNAINPLVRELLLQNDSCALNIDIRAEVNDKKTISVLCLDFIPKEFRYFIMGYIVRKITEELDRKRTKTIVMIREASEIFRADINAVIPARILVLKSYMSHWIRMGRRGLHFCLDTQSPAETKGMLGGQQDLSFFGRLPSRSDRESATEQLKQDNLITPKQITQIATLEHGQFIVCPSGKNAYFLYSFLPRSRFWEEGNGNFYNTIWKNLVDKWMTTDDAINELKDLKKIDSNKIQEKIKLEKILHRKIIVTNVKNTDVTNTDVTNTNAEGMKIPQPIKISQSWKDRMTNL